MTSSFHKYETDFPNLCKVYSIGTSVQGRELWVLQITEGVNDIPKLRIRLTLAEITGNLTDIGSKTGENR